MKLNKRELEAVATRVHNNLCAARDADIRKLAAADDKVNLPVAKKIQLELISLSDETKEYLSSKLGYSTKLDDITSDKKILEKLRTTETKIPYPGNGYHRTTEIVDELTIAQIECTDLNQMIDAVTKKFMK